MWYKFTAWNSETRYGWTTDTAVAEAACAWLNRKRHANLYSADPVGETDDEAEKNTGRRLQDYQGLLITDDSTIFDFAPTVRFVGCLRCGAEWLPRSANPPVRCPKCGSPYWNKPRRTATLSPK